MGRILCIDYGRKRCGVAVTDPLRISANGLPTVRTFQLMEFLTEYCNSESVDIIVVGYPTTLSGTPSESMNYIRPFVEKLRREMPDMRVEFYDERFTSTIAHREMIAGGVKKKDRRCRELVDEIAATIILTDYLQRLHP